MDNVIDHPHMTPPEQDVTVIVGRLTDAMKKCILALSDEWQESGYSKVTADLLYATDVKFFPDRFGPLVDCRLHHPEGLGIRYQHKLLPLGMEVKAYLETQHGGES